MNKKTVILQVLLFLLPGLALAQGQSSNLILLKVNDSQTALEYNAQGSNHGRCQTNPGNGCFRVEDIGTVTFRLVNDRSCDGHDYWELTGVQLGGENSDTKGSWGNLSATAVYDWGADAATGMIETESSRSITVTDRNSQAYSFWYRVRAECNGDTIWFDPRGENTGTGR